MKVGDFPLSLTVAPLRIHDLRATPLYSCFKQYGTGKRARTKSMRDKAHATADFERIRQLEEENTKLRQERDTLFKTVKCFVEKTCW